MKIAHTVENGLGGMSAAARLEVLWERKLGHDARLVFREDNGLGNRDGVPVADFEFVKHCDVIVSHSTLAMNEQELGIPFVLMCHGSPDYCYYIQHVAGNRTFTMQSTLAGHKNCAFVVVHWERHIPYWKQIMPGERIRYIPTSVDLDAFAPQEPNPAVLCGMGGKINVLSAGRWRMGCTPFSVVCAFGLFADRHPGAKLHLLGTSNFVGISEFLESMRLRNILGLIGVNSDDIPSLYAACDFSITSHWDAGLTPRESMACGCPVVGDIGLGCTPYMADQHDLVAFADEMDRVYSDIQNEGKSVISERTRASAVEQFHPKAAAERMIALMQSIRPVGGGAK